MRGRRDQITSPYLLDHVDNPVDWQEWSTSAFEEARERDVPVFLSIGYSACHWCHVMAHESFEDTAVAALLNEGFVSIKVDREERPDVDAIYMEATVALTGSGGWPMSVFLDHDGHPFYAGTYFPPEPRHGLPSFTQLITAIRETWVQRRADVLEAGTRITAALEERAGPARGQVPDLDDLVAAVSTALQEFDRRAGGFGDAPKFPPSMLLEFLLRHATLVEDSPALAMAEATLTAMARGGIYDQLGGGFARYSVDRNWVVPHFEKMLYDNALLLRVYAHWWRLTGSELAARITRQTAAFLIDDLRTREGGFAAALDADSEEGEGVFYCWSPLQLAAQLGDDDGAWAAELLGVTAQGTFEHGLSTLQLRNDPADLERWHRVRTQLRAARAERPPPARDDKVVASWNGLAIAALAEAGALFDEPSWIDHALAAADLLITVHLGGEGKRARLVRTSRDLVAGSNEGVLDDYADVAEGFLALYQVTGESEWLSLAGTLLDIAIEHFADGDGGFFDTADDAPALVRRPRDPADNAEPSGWLALANACITYSAITGRGEYRDVAERALGVVTPLSLRAPRSVGWGLAAATALVAGPLEIAVVGAMEGTDLAHLRRTALAATSPGAVVAVGAPHDPDATVVPLLHGRELLDGRATAYVCRGFVCDLPVTDADTLAARVGARPGAFGSSLMLSPRSQEG